MSIRSVVFDVDDTLYLERDYAKSGFDAVGSYVESVSGRPDFGDIAWSLFRQGVRRTIFDEALSVMGLAEISVPDLVKHYRTHQPSISLLPDAARCLSDLKCQSVSMAVITDGPAESQHAKIAALGLAKLGVDYAVVTADLGADKSKPDETAFRLVEERMRHAGRECVYIGDNPHKDFVAPRKLGWATWRVRRAGGLHAAVADRGDVDHELSDLTRVAQVLGGS